ncbi:MAG: hypothetical protein WCG80_16800 [Spirochaetales bacterium]
MTYNEALALTRGLAAIKDKEIPFKAAFAISKNVIALEKATKSITEAVQLAQAKTQAAPEGDREALVAKLNAEIAEAAGEDCGITDADLFKLPAGCLDDLKVSLAEIHALVQHGLVS